jgi:hypothetical protein
MYEMYDPAPFVVVVLGALGAGCATERLYQGPPLPPAERAIVRADPALSAGLPVTVRLRRVDGREVPLTASRVELAPGAHELLVDCRVRESGALARFALAVEVEAGGSYRLVAEATARNCEAVRLIGD